MDQAVSDREQTAEEAKRRREGEEEAILGEEGNNVSLSLGLTLLV